MDTLRGPFDSGHPAEDTPDWDVNDEPRDEEVSRELPPESIGQDERRMQVRAYNHWASLLGENSFPSIEDLAPENLDDFGPNSVLLDFSRGIEDPAVQFLGAKLADECDAKGETIEKLSDVPPRSLLSRITDHYMQILANQAPIGFEAEFVNERGAAVLYRGILLPFSSNDETIDFIYGVINWKEMADAATADELLLAIDQAIDDKLASTSAEELDQPHKHHTDPVTEWADSPLHDEDIESEPVASSDADLWEDEEDDNIASFGDALSPSTPGDDLPSPDFGPSFGDFDLDEPEVDEFGEEIEEGEDNSPSYSFASLADYIEAPSKKAVDLDADRFDPEDYKVEEPVDEEEAPAETAPEQETQPQMQPQPQQEPQPVLELVPQAEDVAETPDETATEEEPEPSDLDPDATLHDCLASARELAQNAAASEDRSRQALYAAVGRAYDVSLAAKDEPEAFEELIADSGLTVQERAPMTPVVKLVFGHDYDKTRLTEYAAVLTHAHRLGLERGSLANFLSSADGGLKAVVASERRLRREEAGQVVEDEGDVREKLARKLRELDALMFEALSSEGPEFSLVMVRRDGEGNVAMIGEITDDVALIERVGKKLVG